MNSPVRLSICLLGLLPPMAAALEQASTPPTSPAATGGEQSVLPAGSTYWMPMPEQGGAAQGLKFPPRTRNAPPHDAPAAAPPEARFAPSQGDRETPPPAHGQGYGYGQGPGFPGPGGYGPPTAYGQGIGAMPGGGLGGYRMPPPQPGDFPPLHAGTQYGQPPANPQGEYPDPLPPRLDRGAPPGYGYPSPPVNGIPAWSGGRHPCEAFLAAYGLSLPGNLPNPDLPPGAPPEFPADAPWSNLYPPPTAPPSEATAATGAPPAPAGTPPPHAMGALPAELPPAPRTEIPLLPAAPETPPPAPEKPVEPQSKPDTAPEPAQAPAAPAGQAPAPPP